MDLDRCLDIARTCTCFRLRSAARAVTRLYDQALAPAGLRATQYTVLVASRLARGAPLTAIAARLAMDQTTLARALKPLVRRGLLARRAGPADGRRAVLSVTPAGLRLLRDAYPRWRAVQDRIESLLGRAGRDDLHRRLDAMTDSELKTLTAPRRRKHIAPPRVRR